MYAWPDASWAKAGFDAGSLGLQAATVAGLRATKIAMGGDAAGYETRLMLSEKLQSALELQTAMMTGALGATPLSGTQGTLRHYSRKVAANRRRLG